MDASPVNSAVKRIVGDIDNKAEEKRELRKQNSLLAFVMRATARDQEQFRLISRLRQVLQETEDDLILQKIERETYEELVKLREEEIENLKKENEKLKELLRQQEEKSTKIPQKRRRASKTPAPGNINETASTPEISNKSSPAKTKAPAKSKTTAGRRFTRSQSETKDSTDIEAEKSPTALVPSDKPLDTIPEREIPEKERKVLKSFNSLPESMEIPMKAQASLIPTKTRSNSTSSDSKPATPSKSVSRSETISSPSTRIPIAVGDRTKSSSKASNETNGSPKVTNVQRRSALPKMRAAKKERELSVQPAFNFFYNLRKRGKQQK